MYRPAPKRQRGGADLSHRPNLNVKRKGKSSAAVRAHEIFGSNGSAIPGTSLVGVRGDEQSTRDTRTETEVDLQERMVSNITIEKGLVCSWAGLSTNAGHPIL